MQILIILSSLLYDFNFKEPEVIDYSYLTDQVTVGVDLVDRGIVEYKKYYETHYFNGEYIDDIAKKIEKYFNSTLNGKAYFVVEYSLSVGLDPYLAAAVMLQETGCYWNCSGLMKKCNNVAGNKGRPSCGGGSYRKFNTLEDGIKFAINKLNSYYKKGKKTPKQINPYYAESKTWHTKVENYMKKLKKG